MKVIIVIENWLSALHLQVTIILKQIYDIFKLISYKDCCNNAANVVIPSSVTAIPNFAFISCSSLKSVVIPNTVTVIGRYAFHQTGLTSVVIPQGVQKILWYGFAESYSLATITIPDSVTVIEAGAFKWCPFSCITWNPAITRTVPGDAFLNNNFALSDQPLSAADANRITCPFPPTMSPTLSPTLNQPTFSPTLNPTYRPTRQPTTGILFT